MSKSLSITPSFDLNDALLEERFVRSPGPGGQHVNKVSSAVQLRLPVSVLPYHVRQRLELIAPSLLSKNGYLQIESHRFRERERNRLDAREKLVALLRKAFERPRVRRATRVPKRSIRKRLTDKRKRADLKRSRAQRDMD